MEEHELARDLAQVTTGISVVGDVRDALRAKAGMANHQHSIPHFRRHPRIKSVSDNVIELAQLTVDVIYIKLSQVDIIEAKRRNRFFALCDGLLGAINSHKLALRQTQSHRNQVSAVPTCQLQNAAAFDRGRRHAEQSRQTREAIRMCLRESKVRVSNFVVGVCLSCGHVSYKSSA